MRVVALPEGLALAAPVLPDDVAVCNHEHHLHLAAVQSYCQLFVCTHRVLYRQVTDIITALLVCYMHALLHSCLRPVLCDYFCLQPIAVTVGTSFCTLHSALLVICFCMSVTEFVTKQWLSQLFQAEQHSCCQDTRIGYSLFSL